MEEINERITLLAGEIARTPHNWGPTSIEDYVRAIVYDAVDIAIADQRKIMSNHLNMRNVPRPLFNK